MIVLSFLIAELLCLSAFLVVLFGPGWDIGDLGRADMALIAAIGLLALGTSWGFAILADEWGKNGKDK